MSESEHLERIVVRCILNCDHIEEEIMDDHDSQAYAGWTSTILAIKQLREMPDSFHKSALEKFIIAAWPEKLL